MQAVAQALDVPLGSGDPVQQLTVVLAARGDCLLLLDNFEQVARDAEACLGVWLKALPKARFLVTSREVLGLPGEQLQGLAPMTVDEGEALFRQRMQAGLGGVLEAADAAALPDLVQVLDCLPLAIELAASRARVMPPAQQLERMGERFRLLAGRSGRLDRQATLRATLDWSWDLLDETLQSALAQLSVFEGGFTLAAAEAVLHLSQHAVQPWAVDLLQGLVEKSLVQRLPGHRFTLLRAVQDYAAERLPSLDSQAVVRHWQYFAGLDETKAVAGRCVEIDNLVAACRRATGAESAPAAAESAARCLGNAWAALRLTGPFRAAVDLARLVAARSHLSDRQRAQVERVLGGAAHMMGQAEAALRHYQDGLALSRSAGDGPVQAQLLSLMAEIDVQYGRYAEAEAALLAATALARDHPAVRLVALNVWGNLAQALTDLPQAERLFNEALILAEALGDKRWRGGLHGNLGGTAMLQGRADIARPHLELALSLAAELGDRQWAGNAHCNLGLLLHELGESEGARTELQAALQLARSIGHRRLEAFALCNLGLALRALKRTDDACAAVSEAVAVAQDLQAPRLEGQFRGYLGEMLAVAGKGAEALDCLDRAQTLLSGASDLQATLLLQCQRATALAHLGQTAAANTALLAAQGLAAQHLTPVDSEVGRALATAFRSIGSIGDDGVDAGARHNGPGFG